MMWLCGMEAWVARFCCDVALTLKGSGFCFPWPPRIEFTVVDRHRHSVRHFMSHHPQFLIYSLKSKLRLALVLCHPSKIRRETNGPSLPKCHYLKKKLQMPLIQ